jgi:hypothetical protein
VEKRQTFVARKPQETFVINCESSPTMKSLILELQ